MVIHDEQEVEVVPLDRERGTRAATSSNGDLRLSKIGVKSEILKLVVHFALLTTLRGRARVRIDRVGDGNGHLLRYRLDKLRLQRNIHSWITNINDIFIFRKGLKEEPGEQPKAREARKERRTFPRRETSTTLWALTRNEPKRIY